MKGRTIEKLLPVIISLIFTGGYIHYEQTFCVNQLLPKMGILLSLSITISSIALGLIGTIIGLVLSMSHSRVMQKMYITNTDELLISYIQESLLINTVTIVFSGYLMLLDAKRISSIESYIWLFLLIYSIVCSFRITWTLMKLLKIVNSEYKKKELRNNLYKPEKIIIPDKIKERDVED